MSYSAVHGNKTLVQVTAASKDKVTKDVLVTCPVCFKIYDNPVLLNCLHTVCSNCIQWSGRHIHKFTCPVCGDNVKDTVRDHSKQALVQMYHKHTSVTVHVGGKVDDRTNLPNGAADSNMDNNAMNTSPLKCETCKLNTNRVEWKCKECEKCLCNGCKAVHDAIPNCKSHFVQTITAAAQDIKSSAKRYLCILSNGERELGLHLENFFKYRNQIERSTEEVLGSIDDHENMCIQAVKDHHRMLRDSVQQDRTKLKQQLNKEEKHLQSLKGKITKNRDSIEKLEHTDDSAMVVYYAEQRSQDVKTMVEKMESLIPREILPPLLDFNIERTDRLDVKPTMSVESTINYMELKYDMAEGANEVAVYDYNKLLNRVLKPEKSIALQYSPRRLRIIDDHIWCAGTAAFYIYKKDGSLVKTITHENIQQVKAMVQTQSGHVIVACWDGKGLLQLDQTGQFQCVLLQGSFSDVVSCRNRMYALSYENTTVYQFSLSADNNWKHERDIKLMYNNGNNWDSMYAHVNTIYVCSWANNCIYHYNLMGQVLSQYGSSSSPGGAGHFNHPRICDVDAYGNILVVDTDNHNIQVQEHGGNWGYISTTVDIRRPIDALVDAKTGEVWIIQNIPGQTHRLHKLTDRDKLPSSP